MGKKRREKGLHDLETTSYADRYGVSDGERGGITERAGTEGYYYIREIVTVFDRGLLYS